jgi:hypothetical protein
MYHAAHADLVLRNGAMNTGFVQIKVRQIELWSKRRGEGTTVTSLRNFKQPPA